MKKGIQFNKNVAAPRSPLIEHQNKQKNKTVSSQRSISGRKNKLK